MKHQGKQAASSLKPSSNNVATANRETIGTTLSGRERGRGGVLKGAEWSVDQAGSFGGYSCKLLSLDAQYGLTAAHCVPGAAISDSIISPSTIEVTDRLQRLIAYTSYALSSDSDEERKIQGKPPRRRVNKIKDSEVGEMLVKYQQRDSDSHPNQTLHRGDCLGAIIDYQFKHTPRVIERHNLNLSREEYATQQEDISRLDWALFTVEKPRSQSHQGGALDGCDGWRGKQDRDKYLDGRNQGNNHGDCDYWAAKPIESHKIARTPTKHQTNRPPSSMFPPMWHSHSAELFISPSALPPFYNHFRSPTSLILRQSPVKGQPASRLVVMSFDGSVVRSYQSAIILKAIMHAVDKRLGPIPGVHAPMSRKLVDLNNVFIIGASSGGHDARETVTIYEELAKTIFTDGKKMSGSSEYPGTYLLEAVHQVLEHVGSPIDEPILRQGRPPELSRANSEI
ncbi:hypothetical protein K440DRAFT_640904 [Wilcoxina mikolae CBS 423.85]|nr:hypothetical protein K440DRAFT_640904 [Wilcoxina mikolae CBS 423.85]